MGVSVYPWASRPGKPGYGKVLGKVTKYTADNHKSSMDPGK